MEIYLPVHCNEIGLRNTNEDAIYPEIPSTESRLFMVCDGVGGQAKGELASWMVCNEMACFVNDNILKTVGNQAYWSQALKFVENQFQKHFTGSPESKGMASTLSLLYISDQEEKVFMVWIGDSRIYHIRDGKILNRTKDHSIVQAMLEMGEITVQEVKDHPKRHVITRAINGLTPSKVDVKIIEDLQKNDFFMLCSDGILENVDDEKIEKWFKKETSIEKIRAKIMIEANGNTKDNYSMYLIKIDKT
ncbi:protein phosphatase 2C domain-containing protein [Arenibacter sp. GZD96]|uniref:PP2C family protein-serine/threonine phosphatase n=1 Tax=Aurantibrevibacter litoralis TaxID=3106030 RepID=UPI002AFFD6EB|nr:protein phosphatase 2C domain-containing protein [Arenibacter sp. GZD-96]MEA1787276.1 protein phosphatase 2C domain-containing protein [Arenibacter sp. GZD-96]